MRGDKGGGVSVVMRIVEDCGGRNDVTVVLKWREGTATWRVWRRQE